MLTMANVLLQVKMDGAMSDPFNPYNGLACLLFNIVLERAVRDSSIRTRAKIFNKLTQILA